MNSKEFGLYFPLMCSKYGCTDVPFIREIHSQGNPFGQQCHIWEKTNNLNLDKLKSNYLEDVYYSVIQKNAYVDGDSEDDYKNKLAPNKNKTPEKYKLPSKSKQGCCLTFPVIIAVFGKLKNEKTLVNLFMKDLELNIQIILALLNSVRFHKYLRRLDICKCTASMKVISSLKKVVIVSNITELNLDNCCIPELNCASILEGTTSLKKLSLCNCCVDDCGVEKIAKQLYHFKHPSEHLEILNLSSNVISNYGAACLGMCLRTNRRLTSLTLANNFIRDEGCCEIAKSMKCFCLTHKEMYFKEKRNVEYLIKIPESFEAYVQLKLNTAETKSTTSNNNEEKEFGERPIVVQTNSNVSLICSNLCIDEIIERHLGDNNYPFRCSELFFKDGNIYCKGNNTMKHLNLAFNCISHRGIRRIINAIQYQIEYTRKDEALNILLEGNPNILEIPEYHILSTLI